MPDSQEENYEGEDESVWETDSDSSGEEQGGEEQGGEEDEEPSFLSQLAAEIRQDQNAALEEGARRLIEEFGDADSEVWEGVGSVKEEKKEPEPEKEPLFEAPIPLGECPICYEELKMIDFTVTKCGHTFHSSCVFKAMEQNVDCPMCRCQLLEIQEEEDEDDDEEGEEGEDQEEDQEDEDSEGEEDSRPTMDQLAAKLQNMGYTPLDFLTLFMNGILKRQDETRQTDEFLEILNDKIDDIVDGKITMAHVDQRTYAQVAAKTPEPQVQPQPQPQQAAV